MIWRGTRVAGGCHVLLGAVRSVVRMRNPTHPVHEEILIKRT